MTGKYEELTLPYSCFSPKLLYLQLQHAATKIYLELWRGRECGLREFSLKCWR